MSSNPQYKITPQSTFYCYAVTLDLSYTYLKVVLNSFFNISTIYLFIFDISLIQITIIDNSYKSIFVYIDNAKIDINPMECENRKKALEISYIYGYEETPATVKQVLIDLLKLDIETNNSRSIGLQSENWDSEYSYSMYGSKDFTPAEFRKNILKRLDIFKVEPYIELKNTRIVRARLL